MNPKNTPEEDDKTADRNPDSLRVKEPLTLILPDDNKFTTYLFSTFRRTTSTIFVLLLILAIPVTMILLSHPQDLRQRAQFEPTPQTSEKYNVSGKVYLDTNNNGVFDSWEIAPPGATVQITGQGVNYVASVDPYGSYTFDKYGGFTPGLYTVILNLPKGYMPTNAGTINVKLGPTNALVDFGVKHSSNVSSPKI